MADLIRDLTITSLAHGGRGVGHHEGQVVFVPLACPGDRVTCEVVRAKKRYVEAELLEVIEPSPARREAPCPHFGSCGGCQWQHLAYQEQAEWKARIFFEQLGRNGIARLEQLESIATAPDEWRYRNRAQFKCYYTGGRLVIGFYRHGSHFVVDIERCLLLTPRVQEVLEVLRTELPEAPCPDCIPQVDVASGDDGAVRIVLHVLPRARNYLRPWLCEFAQRHQVGACLQSGRKDSLEVVYGEPSLNIRVDRPELSLDYGPGGFVQVNSAQNREMISEMIRVLALSGTENVLDLFCGMGNFSLPLARRAGQVTGVEDFSASIDYARRNARQNGLANVKFYAADATGVMSRFRPGELDVVVLDPPRTGHYGTSRQLLKVRPQRILYVSCDPSTLVRDLKPLVHDGYEVIASRPFDLFPQTWHIESLTLLRRR